MNNGSKAADISPDREPAVEQDRSEERMEALEAEVQRLRRALGIEELRRQEMLSSTSWRITAPVRALKKKGWLKTARSKPQGRATHAGKVVDGRPVIPAPIRADHDGTPEASNRTYRLVDADAAMEPVLRAASARRPAGAAARILFLGSTELAGELAFDAEVTSATEASWRSELQAGRFDYLLIETVWHVNHRDWRYNLIDESGRGREVAELAARCRDISLPVVLWFREDLGNYERFAWLSQHADLVYAIDEGVQERLIKDFPGKSIGMLPAAIQPAIHNPVRSYALMESQPLFDGQVLYDGWWDLATGVSGNELLADLRGSGLHICESEWEFGGVRLADQPDYSSGVLGCVTATDKIALNKLLAVELFLEHGLRLPWRQRQAMMRAAAAGSVVVQHGADTAEDVPTGVSKRGDRASIKSWLATLRNDGLLRATVAHRVRRTLLSSHCVADRLATIASDLGISPGLPAPMPTVAMVLVTMRPQLLARCIDRFRADRYPGKELVVVMHGNADPGAVREMIRPGESISILNAGRERSLGACLNFAIAQTQADYWSKIDDDDLYGPDYLSDLMLSRRWIDFDVAGKPPMFAYLDDGDRLYWDPVWAAHACLLHSPGEAKSALIAGGTITARREIAERIPFSEKRRGGSDSEFIRCCYEAGHNVLAADGFNFARYRSRQAGFHTWRHDNSELHERAVRIGGLADVADRVFV